MIFHYSDAPLRVFGLPFYEENHLLERLPERFRQTLPSLKNLGRRAVGARIGFRTNASSFTVRMTFQTLWVDVGMSIFGCQSAEVMIGERKTAHFAGLVKPTDYDQTTAERTFTKRADWDEITIYLPRNSFLTDVSVEIDDGAQIAPPTDYRYPAMLFYGSSITEGGCCTRASNAYTAILTRHLDADSYNFGFSGAAKGEIEMADVIRAIPMSILIYDYDHNAPSAAHLAATHEPFFARIREAQPELPVVILSRPNFWNSADDRARREIIRETYMHASAAGDRNVWFLDGETFFGNEEREMCTVDGCHPNDLGFWRMAGVIEPLLARILREKYPTL